MSDIMKTHNGDSYNENYMKECFNKYSKIKSDLETAKEEMQSAKENLEFWNEQLDMAQNDWHNKIEEWEGFEPWEKLKVGKE